MRRVVITGMGGVTALGDDWPRDREPRSAPGKSAVRYMTEWERYVDMATRLGGALRSISRPRNTGPASRCAAWAACRSSRCVPPSWRWPNAGLAGSELVGGRQRWAWPAAPASAARRTSLDFAQMLIRQRWLGR